VIPYKDYGNGKKKRRRIVHKIFCPFAVIFFTLDSMYFSHITSIYLYDNPSTNKNKYKTIKIYFLL
jgi:hypothetical protein